MTEPDAPAIPAAPALDTVNQLALPPRCAGTKKDGRRCTNGPALGGTFCIAHEPSLDDERTAWRRKGGFVATRQNVLAADAVPTVSLATADDARRLLEATVEAVLTGKLAVNVANCVGYMVSVGLRLEELRLSATVATLEAELAKRRGR